MLFPFEALLARVQHELCTELLEHGELVKPLMTEIVASTGKYVRTHMILRIAQLNGDYNKTLGHHLVTLCKGIECLHTASLLHDDVVDHGITRRNRPCFYRQWGTKHAVLLGDYLLSTALSYITKIQSLELINEVQHALQCMTLGQIQEDTLSWESPENVVKKVSYLKTASLFEACAACISILLGFYASEHHSALKAYGKILGLCFQVQDDIRDYCGDEGKKTRFQDFFQRRITLPLVWLKDRTHNSEQSELKHWCANPNLSYAQCVYEKLQHYRIVEYAQQWMDSQWQSCERTLLKYWSKSIVDHTLVGPYHPFYRELFDVYR